MPKAENGVPSAAAHGGQFDGRLAAPLLGVGHGGLAREAAFVQVDHVRAVGGFGAVQGPQVLLANASGARWARRLRRQRF